MVPVYALAVLGHWVTHGLLFSLHRGSGHFPVGAWVSLCIVPVLALLVLIGMERERRRGAFE